MEVCVKQAVKLLQPCPKCPIVVSLRLRNCTCKDLVEAPCQLQNHKRPILESCYLIGIWAELCHWCWSAGGKCGAGGSQQEAGGFGGEAGGRGHRLLLCGGRGGQCLLLHQLQLRRLRLRSPSYTPHPSPVATDGLCSLLCKHTLQISYWPSSSGPIMWLL